tara:strand:- start:21990 stop:22409 length:420 start_codon:yes stop_codon:yes gene_type:complete
MDEHNLFFRLIDSSAGYDETEWHAFMDVNPDSNMSDMIHSWFNFESGDAYGWQPDNITKEQLDSGWAEGINAFVFDLGFKTLVMYDIQIINRKELILFREDNEHKEAEKLNNIIEIVEDYFDIDLNEPYILEHLKKSLK